MDKRKGFIQRVEIKIVQGASDRSRNEKGGHKMTHNAGFEKTKTTLRCDNCGKEVSGLAFTKTGAYCMECIQAESWHIPEIRQPLPKTVGLDESEDNINWTPVKSTDDDWDFYQKDQMHDTRAVMLDQGKQLKALWRIVKLQKSEIERLDEVCNLLYELIEIRTGLDS
jgi:hypothetical protein